MMGTYQAETECLSAGHIRAGGRGTKGRSGKGSAGGQTDGEAEAGQAVSGYQDRSLTRDTRGQTKRDDESSGRPSGLRAGGHSSTMSSSELSPRADRAPAAAVVVAGRSSTISSSESTSSGAATGRDGVKAARAAAAAERVSMLWLDMVVAAGRLRGEAGGTGPGEGRDRAAYGGGRPATGGRQNSPLPTITHRPTRDYRLWRCLRNHSPPQMRG